MAASELLINSSVLCFLTNRVQKCELNLLKSVTIDFFHADEISAAKQKLIESVEKLSLSKVPRYPNRNNGDNKTTKEVDDIVSLLLFLDENKAISQLPKYGAESPDAMPSFRVTDSDFRCLYDKVGKMDAMLNKLYAMYELLHNDVSSVRAVTCSASTSTEMEYASALKGPQVQLHQACREQDTQKSIQLQ